MKIRQSFVTNSSSSSYVVYYRVKIENLGDVLKTIQKDYGNKGLKKLFEDIRVDDDSIIFAEGREVENIGEMFESVSSDYYSSDGAYEEW